MAKYIVLGKSVTAALSFIRQAFAPVELTEPSLLVAFPVLTDQRQNYLRQDRRVLVDVNGQPAPPEAYFRENAYSSKKYRMDDKLKLTDVYSFEQYLQMSGFVEGTTYVPGEAEGCYTKTGNVVTEVTVLRNKYHVQDWQYGSNWQLDISSTAVADSSCFRTFGGETITHGCLSDIDWTTTTAQANPELVTWMCNDAALPVIVPEESNVVERFRRDDEIRVYRQWLRDQPARMFPIWALHESLSRYILIDPTESLLDNRVTCSFGQDNTTLNTDALPSGKLKQELLQSLPGDTPFVVVEVNDYDRTISLSRRR